MPFEVSRRFCMLCRQQVFFRQERLPLSVYLFGCFCRWFRLPALEEPRSYGIFLSPGCACCGGAGLSPKSVHLELLPKPSGARLLREVGAAVKFLRSSRPAGRQARQSRLRRRREGCEPDHRIPDCRYVQEQKSPELDFRFHSESIPYGS